MKGCAHGQEYRPARPKFWRERDGALDGGALAGGHYFADGQLGDPIDPPAGFDYDLWLNGAEEEPCRPNMVQRPWRSSWKYGGGQIAERGAHRTALCF